MANHVTSYISFENLSQEAIDFIDSSGENFLHSVYNLSEDVDIDTAFWYNENVGSKWMHFEELSSDLISTVSAWGPPGNFYEALYEKLESLNSPGLEMWVRYDDEMPNFVGVWGRIGDWDYEEYLEEEHYENVIGCTPNILDEDGEWEEFNDDWYEELDKWYDSEYDCFKESYSEYMIEKHLDEKIDRNAE
jgi:hypothetical protein